MPALLVGDVSEWWQNDSRAVRPAMGWYTKAAVVGELSHIGLINPSTSGVNVLVRQWRVYTAATSFKEYEFILTTEAEFKTLTGIAEGATLTGYRDARGIEGSLAPSSAADRTVAGVWAGSAIAQIDGHRFGRILATLTISPNSVRQDVLLSPGTALAIVNLTANLVFQLAEFFWEEHRIPR